MGRVTSKFNLPDMLEFLNRYTLDGRHVELSAVGMMFLLAIDRKACLTEIFQHIREMKRKYPRPKRKGGWRITRIINDDMKRGFNSADTPVC